MFASILQTALLALGQTVSPAIADTAPAIAKPAPKVVLLTQPPAKSNSEQREDTPMPAAAVESESDDSQVIPAAASEPSPTSSRPLATPSRTMPVSPATPWIANGYPLAPTQYQQTLPPSGPQLGTPWPDGTPYCVSPCQPRTKFCCRFLKAYKDEFKWCQEEPTKECCKPEEKKDDKSDSKSDDKSDSKCEKSDEKKDDKCEVQPEKPRRALPAPFPSPPFPNPEYQGFPLIGVPTSDAEYPLMKALYGCPCGDDLKCSRVKAYGWANASGNWSTAKVSNTPSSYWVAADRFVLDQVVFRLEREVDTVQTDHIDVGFRSTVDYGIDYRYFTAGGWFSDQLLVHNRLYGVDPTEQYMNVYFPGVAQGMIVTVGRWIATPDIEAQFAPDNYMGSHSLQFTVDIYTETGMMATIMLNPQWTVQAAIHAGADMAPWYAGAVPTGMFGIRWVSKDNCDSVYTVLNAINNAEYQYFDVRGVPAGHHNYNIIQSTWQHKFSDKVHTKTEAYLIWERNAAVGGTPSIGPVQFNSGGGLGPTVPGLSLDYSVLNYTMFKLSKNDFITFRNEWAKDEHGTRYGFPGNYTSNAIGLTHNFNSLLQIRPEVGYYRNWNTQAFDNGTRRDMWLYGLDVTLRF